MSKIKSNVVITAITIANTCNIEQVQQWKTQLILLMSWTRCVTRFCGKFRGNFIVMFDITENYDPILQT